MADFFYDDAPVYRSIGREVQDSVQDALPPLPPGGYLEPYYTMGIQASPPDLYSKMIKVLQSQVMESVDIDCELDIPKFKIKCTGYRYSNGSQVEFCARLFRREFGDVFDVEFQRRSGDITLFAELYRVIKAQLSAFYAPEGFRCAEVPAVPVREYFFDDSMLPPLEEEEFDEQGVKETVDCLVTMASSEHVDVKIQGLQALAEQASNCNERSVEILGSSCLLLFLASLSHLNKEVQQCAATGLMHLYSRSESFAKQSAAAHLRILFDTCKSSGSSKQTIRVVGKALNSLSSFVSVEQRAFFMSECTAIGVNFGWESSPRVLV